MRSSLARLAVVFIVGTGCNKIVEERAPPTSASIASASGTPKKLDERSAQPSRSAAPIVKLNEEYADKVCACKDEPCRTQVTIDFGDRMAKAEVPTDAEDQRALSAATKRATDCINGK